MPRALVISHTLFQRDPRVRREVEWLLDLGWQVDTLGAGAASLPGVGTHYEYRPEAPWLRPLPVKGVIHALLPNPAKFFALFGHRVPAEVRRTLARADHDLVLVNDIELLPLVRSLPAHSRAVHLDLHEYFPPRLAASFRGGWVGTSYRGWSRRFIADERIATRTTVASGIAELYRDEIGITEPRLVRNAPPFEELSPSEVDADRIDIVYHGTAAWERGLRVLIEAMQLLPQRFHLNLILVGSPAVLDEVRKAAAMLGDRVTFSPPVPVPEIAGRINEYDLEVMFYPPATENLRFALPNKLFEAVQARLGVVVGESPMMAELTREHGIGLVVEGWTAVDLARGLDSLTGAQIEGFKSAAADAASALNSERERETFVSGIGRYSE